MSEEEERFLYSHGTGRGEIIESNNYKDLVLRKEVESLEHEKKEVEDEIQSKQQNLDWINKKLADFKE